jgi:hypothetical protein
LYSYLSKLLAVVVVVVVVVVVSSCLVTLSFFTAERTNVGVLSARPRSARYRSGDGGQSQLPILAVKPQAKRLELSALFVAERKIRAAIENVYLNFYHLALGRAANQIRPELKLQRRET